VLALALASSGCSELDRYGECRSLADTVNPLLAEIERQAQQSASPGPKVFSELAERYRKLKATVRKLPIKDEQLHDAVDAYVVMLTAAEKQLRQSITQSTSKEQLGEAEVLRRHQLGMAATLAQQTTVQGRLRGLCKP
jgi:hypothetical protein